MFCTMLYAVFRFSAKKAKWEQVHDSELQTWANFSLQDSELKITICI
jgi:hypothetical protein